MQFNRKSMRAAIVGLMGLTALAGHLVLAAEPSDSPATFAAWKTAHPKVEAEIADLKAKTAAMIKSAAPFQGRPDYADLAAKSAALSPQQKEHAQQLFAEGIRRRQSADYAGAKKLLNKGLEIDPANPAANFYLGDTLAYLGESAAAIVAMDKAKILGPNTPEGIKAATSVSMIPALMVEDPAVEKPPVIWRVPGAIGEIWDSADAPEMVVIPAGEYTMGSPATEPGRDANEGPRHRVRIAYPLAVSKYPVTVAEFAKFVAEGGYKFPPNKCQTFIDGSWSFSMTISWHDPGFPQGKDSPVVCVSWYESQAYAAWLSKKTGHTYRLLSESEYEYATRGGTSTAYWWGDDASGVCGIVNSADLDQKASQRQFDYLVVNNCHDGHAFTAPVHSFKPNPFGLYGMSGNVAAFMLDCYGDTYYGVSSDGSAYYNDKCIEPVVRGGSWADKATALRAAYRNWNHDWIRFPTHGIRVARVL